MSEDLDDKTSKDLKDLKDQIEQDPDDLIKRVEILERVNQNLRDENKRLIDQKLEEVQKNDQEWEKEYNTTMELVYEGIFGLLNIHHLRKINKVVNNAPPNNSV